MSDVYFEDLTTDYRTSIGPYVLGREEIIEFASRWDPYPFHTDESTARESIFGGLTGSSSQPFALTGLIYARGEEEIALVANLGSEDLRFPSPLRPGDEISLASECLARRPSEPRRGIGIVTSVSRLTNQRQETVMEMKSSFMVRRRQGT